MARPLKEIDADQVEKLAAIMCTTAEMALVLDCSADTLERRFAAAIKKGRAMGKMSLKRKQYETAMKGNVSMLIWLGKQHLEQKDKHESERSQDDIGRVITAAKSLFESGQPDDIKAKLIDIARGSK